MKKGQDSSKKAFNRGLIRYLIEKGQEKGFVLPLSMMLLLVLSLSVTTILIRSGQQSEQVLTTRENKKVYNAASPAMERAKAKIEYYFDEDAPTGEPSGAAIEFKMLGKDLVSDPIDSNGDYTLPDEQRIDINADGKLDNAWAYETDVDGDGNTETVAYSIMMKTEADTDGDNITDLTIADSNLASKAANLVTRSGPLNITASSSAGSCAIPELQLEGGWYKVNESSIRKNFQINAVVAGKNASNRSVVAMEFQQDRQLDRGNKWAAWFRYDLELFPGPDFNWNGAVHTGGNLMVGQGSNKINFHLISSPKSCLYTEDASEITMAEYKKENSDDIEFQGQVMAFDSKNNSFGGNAKVYLYPGAGKKPASPQILDNSKDSVKNVGAPYDYSLDPIVLFTQDKSQSRKSSDPTNVLIRDPNWAKNPINKRIFNKLQKKPYVDDTYRADDRYGPKPRYSPPTSKVEINVTSGNNGSLISDADAEVLTKKNVAVGDEIKVGLDGYWERRARLEGLRLIVGERLELGNAADWQGNKDPLYPIDDTTLDNEQRQRKTLRDNLAAVQSLAIYHQGKTDKDFPVACMAFTAHPGTATTITNSTTFTETTVNGTTRLDANFLTGTGTNGWEFNAPGNVTSSTSFTGLVDSANDPLRIALTNLAYFAGDSNGAFPPKQETSGSIIHPYPQLTMWGNYSNLRRALNLLDGGTKFSDLSIADQSTIHTASCTLGMLAYNVQNIEEQEKQTQIQGQTDFAAVLPGMVAFATHVGQLIDGNGVTGTPKGNGEVNQLLTTKINPPTGYDRYNTCANITDMKCATNFYAQFTQAQFVQAINNDTGLTTAKKTEYITAANALVAAMTKMAPKTRTITDDRTLGFANGSANLKKSIAGSIDWNPSTGLVTLKEGNKYVTFRTMCDPDIFAPAFNANPSAPGFNDKKVALAVVFCSPADYTLQPPKYPSLYYLFPKNNHDHDGTNFDGIGNTVIISEDDQPTTEEYTEEYIADTYIQGINSGFAYKVVNDTNNNGKEDGSENLSTIELKPRTLPNSVFSGSAWELPYTSSNSNIGNKITSKTSTYYIPFLDKGMFNGRELLNTRVLDIDLNLLRNNNYGSDTWLPKTGMVYAFREDAVREDAIARPSKGDWITCGTETALTTGNANCRMKVSVTNPQDPPLNSDTGVSPKAVDGYPDPDRRPHGFRLRNGSNLSRPGDRGLSFISDQPVYIQGNFNLHTSSGSNVLEEFTQLLPDTWSNFYDRTTLDTSFAKPSKDNWRPSETIADAVSILSDNFCDGAIEDGFKGTNTNCSGGESSYRNYTIKPLNNNSWNREDGTTTNTTLPIYVDRNGFAWRSTTKYLFNTTNYNTMSTNRINGTGVNGQRVNTIIVSGLTPSRPGSSYGGLHNFPRFLENWSGQNLYISGSMIQLNFSSYATGIFDQEKQAWEPGGSGQTGESLPFYGAPNRRWGYDVALQYNPPGPVAARFVSQGTPRSEFYRELPVDDPYAKQLRCAAYNGGKVDQNATDCN
jgi:hypothetical protein